MNVFAFSIALFIGYFILRFGMVSRGDSHQLIQFLGGLSLTICFISSFFLLGLAKTLFIVLVFWFVVTPIVEIIVSRIEDRINAPYKEVHEHMAKKYAVTQKK